ncbi:hypothetical protein UO65_0917 [Actinokineospora spheciospongiae]|uniref:DUF7379 domain-containing protein n=1 Tax=Actinokineospora spheciospongiae TaxID=909613 RepID=W7J413_9PSEU|nr:hypothetical protein [Actinokineospora spheciospongiae]EWC63757.1 hypothetical protein UO65_0917 [Actinokineospora spheciospongiae]
MAEDLRPDGTDVRIGDVVVSSPGLIGRVEVHPAGGAGMRGAEAASAELLSALARNGFDEQLTVELLDPVEVPELASGATRSTAAGGPGVRFEVPGPGTGLGQVVLAKDEQGVLSWVLPDDITPAEVATRGGDRRSYTIARRVAPVDPGADPSRGLLGALGSKLLKVLVFPLVDPVIGEVGEYFVSRWEQRYRPVRLRRFTPEDHALPQPVDPSGPDWAALAAGPALLFVHGTASSSHAGFGGLPREAVLRLHERYGGRVLAFDHRTLSVDPVVNARELVERVPEGAGLEVDVLAHSRGGLVGRVLCELPGEVGLDPGRLRVRTLVMVATPNAGTALAHPDNLDRWLDRMTNLLQLVPVNAVTDVLDVVLTVVKQLALGVLKGLEGLMSMNPAGDFLTTRLNVPAPHAAVYRAVASDYDPPPGAPLLACARDGLTDLVFGSAPNDLVVPTDGVFAANGASAFPVGEPEVFAAADAVDHSGYWARPRVVTALDRWLTG